MRRRCDGFDRHGDNLVWCILVFQLAKHASFRESVDSILDDKSDKSFRCSPGFSLSARRTSKVGAIDVILLKSTMRRSND
jgi:hypothetical protein